MMTTFTDFIFINDKNCSFQGCYIHGLFLEGARTENRCLERSFPKVLVEPLPILSIQPIEAHRLKLQVCTIHCR